MKQFEAKTDNQNAVPMPSVKRLPLYLRVVHRLQRLNKATVTCRQIGAELHLDPTQVRKDLAAAGATGRPRRGYDVKHLLSALEKFLGWNRETPAVVIGAGSLGSALLGYEDLRKAGLRIIGSCDVCPSKVGGMIHGRPVWHMRNLAELAPALGIEVVLLAVPAEHANDAAQAAVEAGIKGIWNFTNTNLHVPPHVIVERADLAASLAALTSRMSRVEPAVKAANNLKEVTHVGYRTSGDGERQAV